MHAVLHFRPVRPALLPPLLAALILTTGGCADRAPVPGPTLEQREHSINNGELEPGEPGVVLLVHQWYGAGCTGTLVGKRVVLTAKHCVMTDNGQMFPPAGWSVYVGPSQHNLVAEYGVVDVRTTTGISIEDRDVAVLLLDEEAQEEPYRYAWEIDAHSFVGSDALLIGYGQDGCPNGSSGTKRRTIDTVVAWQSTNDFVTQGLGGNSGDSGGPVFDPVTMKVVGVISRASIDTCDGYTVATRIDVWRDLVNDALSDTGDCAPSAAEEVCNDHEDNDCNGETDEGCEPVGAPCTDHSECASRLCADVGTGGRICTESCDPGGDHTGQCGGGAYCQFVECGLGACSPGTAGLLDVGETCTRDTDCQSLLCSDLGSGSRACMVPCSMNQGHCLGTETCVSLQAGTECGGCAPQILVDPPYGLGERCETHDDCRSELCIDDGGLLICSKPCNATSCPEGFHCRGEQCVLGHLGDVAEACLTNEDCKTEYSCYGVTTEAAGFYTAECSGGENCPAGTECDGVACLIPDRPLGDSCSQAGNCHSKGCFAFNEQYACTWPCERQVFCPPLSVCVVSDSGATLCQPNRIPVVDPEPPKKPKKDCSTGGTSADTWLVLLILGALFVRRRRP